MPTSDESTDRSDISGDADGADSIDGDATGVASDTVEYNKLVRDGVPAVIRENDETPVTRTVEGSELERYLLRKLVEEAEEALTATDDPEESVDEELADLSAVLEAVLDRRDRDRIDRLRRTKADDRGEFDAGTVLERVERR